MTPEALDGEKLYWTAVGMLCFNIGGFFGMMTLSKIAQTKGRKVAFAVAITLSFLSTLLVFRYMRDVRQMYCGCFPSKGLRQLSVFAVYAIYLPELFPTRLRSTGTSFCYNFGRLFAASAPFTIGVITKKLGGDIEGFRTAGMWVKALSCF